MRRFNWLWMLTLAASLFITACNQDDDLTPTPDVDHSQWITMLGQGSGSGNGSGSGGGGSLLCYDVVYPISFILPNGMVKTVNSEGQLLGLLNSNPGPIQIEFPITLEDADGNEIEANDEAELQMYLDMCEMDDDDWEDIFGDDDLFDCYEVQFPIFVEMSDGTTEEVNDVDELIALFDDEPYPVAPVFPITLVDEDGNEYPVNGPDDLAALADDCDDDDDNEWEIGDLECYELGYPVNILLEDGTTATANDPDELAQILVGSPAPVDFEYPITLIDEDGNEVPVNDADELEDLIDDCDDDDDDEGIDWDEYFDNDCYQLVYPQDFVLSDNSTATAADEAAFVAMFDDEPYPVDFVYGGTLVDADGNEYPFNDEDEFYDILDDDDCDDDDEGIDWDEYFDNECYQLVYPQDFVLSDNSTATAADEAAFVAMFDDEPYPVDFVYGGTLVDTDGNEYPFNDEDEFYNILDDDDCDDDDDCNHGLMTSFFTTLVDLNPMTGCYELTYPVTLVLMNGNEETIDDQPALVDYLSNPGNFAQIECILFDIEVTKVDDGTVIIVDSPEALEDLVDDCDD